MNSTKFWKLSILLLAAPLFAGCDSNSGGGGEGAISRTLTVAVSGNGTVTSTPAGLVNCNQTASPDCSENFVSAQSVTLTATPDTNFAFRAWAGACTSTNGNTCTFVSDRDRTIVAVFESTISGGGGGTVGLTADNRLFAFDLNTPGGATAPATVTGLQAGDSLVGIDFRPSNGLLYALAKNGSEGRLYIINEDTNTATLINTLRAQSGDDNPYTGLTGTQFGVDFQQDLVPASSDRLRVISNTGENLRINVANADVATDTNLSPGTPSVTAAAYTNSFVSTSQTTLYVIDTGNNKLYTQAPPASGALTEVGDLNIVASETNGFDIDATNGFGALVTTVGGERRLYTVNLGTGAATLVGAMPAVTVDVRGAAIPTPRTPEVFAVRETSPQALVRFSPLSPNSLVTIGTITGLNSGENVVAMTFRQSDGFLYALGSTGQVYILNPFTAEATATPAIATAAPTATDRFGISFNPVTDLMRIVSTFEESLRVDVDSGVVTPDPDLGRPPFSITASAYDSNTTGASETVQYVIDSIGDRLMTLTDEGGISADGQLTSIGALGVDASGLNGFTIVGSANAAYASFTTGPLSSALYSINLSNGQATLVGTIGIVEQVRGIAMQPVANPAANADVWAVTATNRLISFARNAPDALTSNRLVAGLNGNVVGLEFRPTDNATFVYALTDTSQICSISIGGLTPGVATCSPLMADPVTTYPLTGASFGFDYDPVQNIWRIVSDTKENLNVDPTSRIVTPEPEITENPDLFVGAAVHTNNFVGATSTALYVIDGVNNSSSPANLKTVPDPEGTGLVSDVGILTIINPDLSQTTVRADDNPISIDILGGHNGLALVAIQRVNRGPPASDVAYSTLYWIKLATGQITLINDIGPAPLTPAPETRIVVGSIAIRFPP